MKSVLMSIQPKWCELIASGKKTVEVRKTRPKLETPFKVYIYCTQTKTMGNFILCKSVENVKLFGFNTAKGINKGFAEKEDIQLKGKVIGEFVCKCVTSLKADNIVQAYYNNTQATCLTDTEIKDYANGSKLYYWHISSLVIYDEPKELSKYGLSRPPQSWCYIKAHPTEEGGAER